MTNPVDPYSGAYSGAPINNTPNTPPDHSFLGKADPFASFKGFLGEEGYQKFVQIYCQELINQINKEAAKMKKLAQKLKRTFSGQDAD